MRFLGLAILCAGCSIVFSAEELREIDAGVGTDAGTDAETDSGPCISPSLANPAFDTLLGSPLGNMQLLLNGDACPDDCYSVTMERDDALFETRLVCFVPGESSAPFWHHYPLFTADTETTFTVDGFEEGFAFGRAVDMTAAATYDGTASVDIDDEGNVVFGASSDLAGEATDGMSIYRWNLDGSFTLISQPGEEARQPRISNDGTLVAYFEDVSERVCFAYETGAETFRRGCFVTGSDTAYRPDVGALDLGRNGEGHLFAVGTERLYTGIQLSGDLRDGDGDITLDLQTVVSSVSTDCEENGQNPEAISLASGADTVFVSYTNPCLYYYCQGQPGGVDTCPDFGLPDDSLHTPVTDSSLVPIIETGYQVAGNGGRIAGFFNGRSTPFTVASFGDPGDTLNIPAAQSLLVDADDALTYFVFRDTTEGHYSISRRGLRADEPTDPERPVYDIERRPLNDPTRDGLATPTANALSPVSISPNGLWAAFLTGDSSTFQVARLRVH